MSPRLFRIAVAIGLLATATLFVFGHGPARIQRLATIVTDQKKPNTDFFQNWAAATDYHSKRPIYSELHLRFEADFRPYLGAVYRGDERPEHWGLFGPRADNVLQINAHPPFATLLTLWSGYLSYSQAHTAWTVMNLGMLLITAGLVLGGAPLPSRLQLPLFLFLLVFLLASEPLRAQLVEGNWNILLMLLMVAAWRLLQKDRYNSAAVLIGIAALVKLYPGLLVVVLLLQKRYRASLVFFLTLIAGGLLTLAVIGWQAHWDYATVVIPRIKMQQYLQNVSLVATAGRLFDPARANVIPLVVAPALVKIATAAVGGLLVLPLAWHGFRRRPFDLDGLYLAVMLLCLLFSPVLWPHGFLQAAFPIWVLLAASVKRSSATLLLLTTTACLLFWPNPTEIWDLFHTPDTPYQPWETVTTLAAPLIGLILLYIAALKLALRSGEST